MKAVIQVNSRTYTIQIDQPLDISIPLRASKDNVNAWYLPPPKIYPSVVNKSVVSIGEGATVNFNTIEFNPHAHGTHTECVGHITKELNTINDCLTQGMKINTNKDNLTLIINIDAIVNTIVRGSLIINSKIDKKEC